MVNVRHLLSKREWSVEKIPNSTRSVNVPNDIPLETLILSDIKKGTYDTLIPLIFPLKAYQRAKDGFYDDKDGTW